MAGPTPVSAHQSWSSRFAFMAATIGFSVGLGNIWRFPYLAGESGGGAFVLIYIVCVLLIGVPIVMAEMAIGRKGGQTPIGSLASLATSDRTRPLWALGGGFVMLTSFLIVTFYCVIGGWALHYVYLAVTGALSGIDGEQSQALFSALLADPGQLILWQAVFLALNVYVVSKGLHGGIERAVTILMPILFVSLAGLAVYGVFAGDGAKALSFLFAPDFSVVTGKTLIDAMGQAFFSVGVGMAAMMTYGAYLPKSVDIPSTSVMISLADTGVALVAGLAIFPFVFALGFSPSDGAGLVFVTLPAALSGFAGGYAALAFFILLSIAALTSSIALLEVSVSWAEEKGKDRKKFSWLVGLVCFVIGLGSVISFNVASEFYPLSVLPGYETATIFDVMDQYTSTIGLPLGGLIAALFVGWAIAKDEIAEEIGLSADGVLFQAWRFSMRFMIPLVILILLITGTGE